MKKLILAFLGGCLVTSAIVSVATGSMESHADASFLAIAGGGVLLLLLWALLYSKFDKTNGNDTGIICWTIMLMVFIAAVIIVPILVFLLGHAILITGIALGIMVALTAFMTHSVIG